MISFQIQKYLLNIGLWAGPFAMIIKCGCGALMTKFNIKSPYRILPIHTSDRSLFGMLWENLIFIDLCLAFGLRSASYILNDFAVIS